MYQPGLLFVPFGLAHRRTSSARGRASCTTASSSASRRSTTSTSSATRCTSRTAPTLAYDVLVVATGASARPRRDRGADRCRMDGDGVHLLHARGCRRARGGAGELRRRPPRRERRRHADQVSGRAAGVLLPRRLVLPRARHPRPRRAHLRDAARRRVHQARRVGAARRDARREAHRARHGVQHRRGRRGERTAHLVRRPRGARSISRSSFRCTVARRTSGVRPASATS